MLLKFVNDSDRYIYAFEMLPPPAVDVPDDVVGQEFTSENCVANNTVTVVPKSFSQPTDVLHTCDIVNDLLLPESSCNQSPVNDDCEGSDRLNNRMESSLPASFGDVALLESNPDVNWQHNQLIDNNVLPLDSADSNSFVGDGMWASSLLSPLDVRHCVNDGEECSHVTGETEATSSSMPSQTIDAASAAEERQTEDGGGDAETNRVADEWKSCAICLEEMEDDQLLVHAECGGTLCPDCHGVRCHLLISGSCCVSLCHKF